MTLRLELRATDLVDRSGQQLTLLNVANTTRPRAGTVAYQFGTKHGSKHLTFPHGTSHHWLTLPAVTQPTTLRVECADQVTQTRVRPARKWTIHLVNHTHTDIGYVDHQHNVEHDFYHFLLEAMALVEQTRSFPEPARFRWTSETSFHIRNFIDRASQPQIRQLITHLRRGSIEAAAGFLQMTDLPNADQVIRSFRFIHSFARQHRIPVCTSMACDINGLPWMYPAALHDLGADNLSMAINADMARCPLERPIPFWWESPDAKRILVWHGEIYLLGNRWGIERGAEFCQESIANYLRDLAAGGYPYEHALVLMSGVRLDCAPPTIGPSLTVRDWNARFTNPTLRLDTLSQWFTHIRQTIPDDLPVYRGHWPDYWAHGLGSGVDEVRFARETQHLMRAAGLAGAYVRATRGAGSWSPDNLEHAYDQAELANEHTWGAACSGSRPYSDVARMQWQVKRDYFYSARVAAEVALHNAMENVGRDALAGSPGVVIHNALAWPRNGIAELDCVQRPLPGYRMEKLVHPTTHRAVPWWSDERRGTLTQAHIACPEVPATGHLVLPIVKDTPNKTLEPAPLPGKPHLMENKYYRVRLNPRTGIVESIYDRQLRRNLVRRHPHLAFGRIVYEELPSAEARMWANAPNRNELLKPRAFSRSTPRARRLTKVALPGRFQEISFEGTCRGLDGLATVIRLYENTKRIDLIWRLLLPEHTDPHAAYVAFPFAGAKPRTWLEVPGAPMEPGNDQIPTTCYDFYTVQNFSRIEAQSTAITLVPRDTPLVQLNDIATFQFREKLPRFNGAIIAWLFNNYWHTNFPVRQPGEHLFRFSLTSGRPRTHAMADSYRFAYDVANPLRARFLPETPAYQHRTPIAHAAQGSLLSIEPKNVTLLAAQQTEQARTILLQLQETAGTKTQAVLRFAELPPRRAWLTNLYGEHLRPIAVQGHTVRCSLPPSALATVKVELKPAAKAARAD